MAFLRSRSRLATQAVAADQVAADQEGEELPVSQADKTCPRAQGEMLDYAQFKVVGEPSSQFLMRIFGLFAQQDLLPEMAAVHNLDGVLIVRMTTALIARHRAGVIAEKMRSLLTMMPTWMKRFSEPSLPLLAMLGRSVLLVHALWC